MATRFAGSRSVDERRRRRLATELDENSSSQASATDTHRLADAPVNAAEASPFNPTRLPLKRLVSPTIWKHTLIAIVGLSLGGLIIAAGLFVEQIEHSVGPAAANLVDFETGDLVSIFCAISLFLAGQLSLLIWWVRSRSRQDFSGRYRIWSWAALFAFAASFAMATDLHHVWTATLLHSWNFGFWKQETLLWLAPAIGSASALIWEIKNEFRDCRGSIALFVVAILAWSSAVGVLLFDAFGLAEPLRTAAIAGATMLGYFALMLSLLIHARHVIYITAEPPKDRPSRLANLAKRLIPSFRLRLRLPRRRAKQTIDAETEPEADIPEPVPAAEPKESAMPKTPKPKAAPRVEKKKQEAASVVDEPPVESEQERSRVGNSADDADDDEPQSRPVKKTRHRIDEAVDPAQLKGLSKKERRKFRKEHRDQQRTANGE